MGPRFSEEIVDYLRINGATTRSALGSHFAKWGADEEDLRVALEHLLHEGLVEPIGDGEERFQLRTAR